MASAASAPPTCTDYRRQMLLLSLHRRLAAEGLTDDERLRIRGQIECLESEMGMD